MADGVGWLDPEDAGHVAVHQDVAQLLVLDVDHGGHGVDDLLQQAPAFGDRIFGALLIRDVAHRAFVADDRAGIVAHHGRAVRQPEHVAVVRAHLILEFAHHAVAPHQRLVFRAGHRMHINALRNVADAVDQILRRVIAHHPRQRRIGVEQFPLRRRHIDAVDRGLEQLAIAFLGQPLLGQSVQRRLPCRVGIDQRAAEYFGGPRDIADLVVHVGRRNRGILLASGQRADRGRDRGQRADGPPHHQQGREQSDHDAGGAEHDALPFCLGQRPRKIARQHVAAAVADLAQQFGDPLDQASLGAENFLVDIGDLTFADRYGNDRVGVIVDGAAQFGIRDRQRPHALRRLFGGRRIVRQQSDRDPALGLEQDRADRRGPGLRRWPRRTARAAAAAR